MQKIHQEKKTESISKYDLFYRQLETLVTKGYPEAAGMEEGLFLGYYIKPLLEKVHASQETDAQIPFLIVIPERFVSIPKQISLLNAGSISSYLGIHLGRIKNDVITPDVPYLIYDVRSGISMCGKSYNDYFGKLQSQNRIGLTVEEGIALITHYPETLEHHSISLYCSRYDHVSIPYLALNKGKSMLGAHSSNFVSEDLGSAHKDSIKV